MTACTAGWPGSPRCHCTICGRNFLNISAFDLHRSQGGRTGKAKLAQVDGCIDPIAVGLRVSQSGFYGTAEGIDRAERSVRLLQDARAVRSGGGKR